MSSVLDRKEGEDVSFYITTNPAEYSYLETACDAARELSNQKDEEIFVYERKPQRMGKTIYIRGMSFFRGCRVEK